MPDRIEGQVAQILTLRELVINRGQQHGVEVGMRFAVLNRRGSDITDPETHEVLGSVEIEKVLVKVVRVDERLSVARTFRTYNVAGGAMWPALSAISVSPPRREVETFATDEKRMKDELDEKDSSIKIGDPVVQIIGDEFDDTDA